MSEQSKAFLWAMRLTYVLLSLLVLFFLLLPLETTPRRWAGPDLVLLLSFTWAVRRPDYVPALLIAAVALLQDLLLQRPPGLMAAFMVLGIEVMKRQSRGLRDQSFALEWLTASAVMLGMMVAYRLILALLLIPQAPFGLTIIQLAMTILAYPLIAALSHFLLGVRKITPGDGESLRTGR